MGNRLHHGGPTVSHIEISLKSPVRLSTQQSTIVTEHGNLPSVTRSTVPPSPCVIIKVIDAGIGWGVTCETMAFSGHFGIGLSTRERVCVCVCVGGGQ